MKSPLSNRQSNQWSKMKNNPASEENTNSLYDSMGINSELNFPSLCHCIDIIKQLRTQVSQNNSNYNAELLLSMLELKAFVITVQLDVITFMRASFRAKHPCEKRIHLKYVCVAILEGCKYLHGFGKDTKHAKLFKLERIALANNDNELKADILILCNSLDVFLKQYNSPNDKTNRDLALHYDQDPLKVYDFLEQISQQTETDRFSKFFHTLNSALLIAGKYIEKHESIVPDKTIDSNVNIDIYKQINIFPDKDSRIYSGTEEIIDSYSNRLDSMVRNCRLPAKICEKMGEKSLTGPDAILKFCQPLIKEIYPVIHTHYIYLDLACAFRAYFSSESFVERQLNLRRITVVLYDGFARIYGCNSGQQEQSFWKSIYSNLQNNENIETAALLNKTQNILDDLSKDQSINNSTLRECFIHYRKGNVDNVIKLHEETVKAFPMFEMVKALKLLNILPDIIKLNTVSLAAVNRDINKGLEKTRNETMGKFNSVLDMISDPDTKKKFKDNIIDMIELMYPKLSEHEYSKID